MAFQAKLLYEDLDIWRRSQGLSWAQTASKMNLTMADVERLKTPLYRQNTVKQACSLMNRSPLEFDPSAQRRQSLAARPGLASGHKPSGIASQIKERQARIRSQPPPW